MPLNAYPSINDNENWLIVWLLVIKPVVDTYTYQYIFFKFSLLKSRNTRGIQFEKFTMSLVTLTQVKIDYQTQSLFSIQTRWSVGHF